METFGEYRELNNPQKLVIMKQELEEEFDPILRYYLSGIIARPLRIQSALDNGNVEEGLMESHSLKNICHQLGLDAMGEIAATVEHLCKSGAIEQALPPIHQLIASSHIANQEITHFCGIAQEGA
ncbi:MAG: Hpt domain-containing protein [Magnetococcales bacterium]|nr:Hpt domain-containing protein [Magnetococcales bacterium]